MDDSDRIVELYQRHAHDYDRERGRTLFERSWLERFLVLMPQGASVLDIGCGSGEPIARMLIEQGCDVTGIDSSPAMIELCRSRFPDSHWHVADMRGLSLGRRFDGILVWDSFFHLRQSDQRMMFDVFRAHAAPEAALMFTSGPRASEAIGSYHGEPLYHASLAHEEYRSLLSDTGFATVSYVPEDPDCGGHTVWLARRAPA